MLKINRKRLFKRLEELSKIGSLGEKGVQRLALSKEDKQARDLLKSWMEKADLEVKIDKLGNMFGILNCSSNNKYIGSGSHLDTVPTGGYYDGALGVISALEAVETIKEAGLDLPFNLVVSNFTNEEGVRFTPDMMGSLCYAKPDELNKCWKSSDENSVTVKDALTSIGYLGEMSPGDIYFDKFIELHIEQGPVLEANNIDIGIVDRVQGIYWVKLEIEGRNAHAGTTPMHLRADPFAALAHLSSSMHSLTKEIEDLKVTTGYIELFPNAINVIPKKVEVTFDIRHPNKELFDKSINLFDNLIKELPLFQKVKIDKEVLVHINPVNFDPFIVNTVQEVANSFNYSSLKMYSGAGHDAQLLSSVYSSAMIFIPSVGGVSHTIDEYSTPEQVEKGANVLLHSILSLTNKNG